MAKKQPKPQAPQADGPETLVIPVNVKISVRMAEAIDKHLRATSLATSEREIVRQRPAMFRKALEKMLSELGLLDESDDRKEGK